MPSTANEFPTGSRNFGSAAAPSKRPLLRQELYLTLASAAIFTLCPPGRSVPWLAWVAMVPLLFGLRQTSPWRGFLCGGLFGWLMWFTSVWWLYAPLHDIVGLARAGAVLFTMAGCLLMALPYAISGLIVAACPRKPGIIGAARDAAIFTAAITWLTPVFEGNVAHTQYRYPLVLQVLELGGTPLLLFLMLSVNCLVADAIGLSRINNRCSLKSLAAAIVILAAVIGYSAIRLHQFDGAMKSASRENWIHIGAVQPNIPITVSPERQPDPAALENSFFTALEQAKELATHHPDLDLIALPENPATFLFNQDTQKRDALGRLIKETGKPVLLNADAFDASQSEPRERYNVSLLMDTNRNLASHYEKVKRVPIVEYIPGEAKLPWLRQWLKQSQRVLAGPGAVVFPLKTGIRLIPLICYEGTISSFTRQFVEKGGNVIVNQVNDSWFLRTPASEIHLALTLFRSVEYRVPLVRVTNSGVSAHLQPTGTLVPASRTGLFTKAATAFPLYVPQSRSLYAVIGNWWMLGFVFMAVAARLRK